MISLIGKIKRIPLHDVWECEADFTAWLQDNIETVGEAVGLEFDDNVECEQAAGPFRIDLVAEYGEGDVAIIENQLTKSDHDHLGKVITYLVKREAKTAIWIVSDPRLEHTAAITWLNESYSADFYLLKIEAVKIGDSDPAPLVTLIVGPSEKEQELTEHEILLKHFWTSLLKKAKNTTELHASVSPSKDGYLNISIGISGLYYNYAIRKDNAQVGLYINCGNHEEENREILEKLKENQSAIEDAFEGALEWQDRVGVKACQIRKVITSGGYLSDESKWSSIHKEMIDAMVRLEKALSPFIREIKI